MGFVFNLRGEPFVSAGSHSFSFIQVNHLFVVIMRHHPAANENSPYLHASKSEDTVGPMWSKQCVAGSKPNGEQNGKQCNFGRLPHCNEPMGFARVMKRAAVCYNILKMQPTMSPLNRLGPALQRVYQTNALRQTNRNVLHTTFLCSNQPF